jgi:hypothetical protein
MDNLNDLYDFLLDFYFNFLGFVIDYYFLFFSLYFIY